MKYVYSIITLFIISLLLPMNATGQTRTATVSGTVVDADNNNAPMIGATIIISPTQYDITKDRGEFSIANVPVRADSITIEISYLGYKTVERKIKVTAPHTSLGTIALSSEGTIVDVVTIAAPATTAIQKGDTVQYNAAAFKTNPDAYAVDLVNKLPGVQVNEGSVESQGQTISRVYVDNKLIFGEDAMAALNNLPADMIENVQVFDEQTDEAKYTGYDDGTRNRALNLTTRGAKITRTTTARINGGYGWALEDNILSNGSDGLYNFQGNVTSSSHQNSINGYANFSNVATSRFGVNNGLSTTREAGIGFNQKWKKVELTGNYRFNGSQGSSQSITKRDYFPTEQFDSRLYQDTTYNRSRSDRHNIRLEVLYRIDDRNTIRFLPNVSFSNSSPFNMQSAANIVNGTINSVTNTRNQSKTNSFSTDGRLFYFHRFTKPGRSVSTNFYYSIGNDDGNAWQIDTSATTTHPRFLNNITDNSSKVFGAGLNYSEPIAKGHTISIRYNARYESNDADKRAFDYLIGDYDNMDISLSNTYRREAVVQTVGLGYNITTTKTRINLSMNFNHTHLIKDQIFPIDDNQSRNFISWLPQLNIRHEFSKTKLLEFRYNARSSVPSITDLQNVITTDNLLQLTTGNPNLKPTTRHSFNLNYNSQNLEKSTSFGLRSSVEFSNSYTGQRTVYFVNDSILIDYNDFFAQTGSQLSIPVNVKGYVTGNVLANYSFPIQPLRLKINTFGMYNFLHEPSYTGGTLNHMNRHRVMGNVNIVSNISSNVDFSVRYSTDYTYTNNSARTNSHSWGQNVSANVYLSIGGFVFNNELNYRNTYSRSSVGTRTEYCIWNAGLGYKFLKKKQAEVRVTVYDLLKQRKSYNYSVNINNIQEQWNTIRGRYVMATFSYRFNSLDNYSRPSGEGREFQGPPPGSSGRERRYGPPPGAGGGGGFGGGGRHPF